MVLVRKLAGYLSLFINYVQFVAYLTVVVFNIKTIRMITVNQKLRQPDAEIARAVAGVICIRKNLLFPNSTLIGLRLGVVVYYA